ncbi:MAG: UDP-3-O-(3-hydroxymyristoyl)glucosamine N-acyltransferase [Candidatus Omnitrophota bacterium]
MENKKNITLKAIADCVGGKLLGSDHLIVDHVADIEEAQKGALVFVFNAKSKPLLENTKATAACVTDKIEQAPIPIIRCKNPNAAFKKCIETFFQDRIYTPCGIDSKASIGKNVKFGNNVAIGAMAVIGDNVEIGDNSIIYPNVSVYRNTKIGKRVIIHSGSVIGADGFGYEIGPSGHEKIPQIGNVIIEDDVELGASVMVDRAKIGSTIIGRGTKIDNLVQVAHNVKIGQNCVIAAQCGISGSIKIGNNVVMGGQVGLADHIEIGDNVMLAAKCGVIKSVPANTIMWGIPARTLKKAKIRYALADKLPEFYKKLKELEKRINSDQANWKNKIQ